MIARRYAAALYAYADEKNALEAVEKDLKALAEAIAENPHYHTMATHPRLSARKVVEAIGNFARAIKAHDVTTKFLELLGHNRRLSSLSLIIQAFEADLARARKEHHALVSVAAPLSAAQEKKLATQLGHITGGVVKLEVTEDPALIGGLTIQVDSHMIDASVQGRLARLERQLKSQQEAA